MLILTKLSFWKEDWTLCYSSMKFWYFPDISHFPKILNLSSFWNLFTTFINYKNHASFHLFTAWKVSKYGVFSGLHFPVFGLNTEIYGVNLRIQSEYRKTRTRKNSVLGNFSRSVFERKIDKNDQKVSKYYDHDCSTNDYINDKWLYRLTRVENFFVLMRWE